VSKNKEKKKSETYAFDFPDFALEVGVLCLILDIFCACRDTEGMKRAGWRGMRRGGMAGHGFRWQATGGSSRGESSCSHARSRDVFVVPCVLTISSPYRVSCCCCWHHEVAG